MIERKEGRVEKAKKTWIAMLLGGLVLASLVGAVWARPRGGPAARDTAHKLDRPKAHHGGFHYTATIPGGHFHPNQDGQDWYNGGYYVQSSSGGAIFTAPAPILPGNRAVESVSMNVWDNNGSNNACVSLYRTKADGTYVQMAHVCSAGSSGSAQKFSDTSISPSTIWGGHGAYLWLWIADTSIYVYSVQIKYY